VHAPFFSDVAVDWIIQTKSDFETKKKIGGVSMIAFESGIELLKNGSV